jgi:membrane complex biogenesis BtpA family protein
MKRKDLEKVFGTRRPILGMVHLPPLPGSPNYGGSMTKVIDHALADARTLKDNGISAVIVENLGDYPYYPMTTEPETVAAMTRAALEVRRAFPDLPIGINVLRNSWKSDIAVALVADAQFIRLNVLTDAMVTDQGIINGEAHLLLRYRKNLGARHILLFCDIYSKHAGPVVERDLSTVAHEMVERGMADALIVAGPSTPVAPDAERIRLVREAVPDTPVILGSGMTLDAIDKVALADGSVFGYGAKPSGDMNDPVDGPTVKAFVEAVRKL